MREVGSSGPPDHDNMVGLESRRIEDGDTEAGDRTRSATRITEDGDRIEASVFETAAGCLFGVSHVPARPTGRAVVICTALYSDQLKNNRREVLLSHRLAQSGVAVQRFSYAGTGNSEGDAHRLTVRSMIDDSRAALAHLGSRVPIQSVGFVGTKLGALAAAAMAGEEEAPLVLWEPADGASYFRDLFRTSMIVGLAGGGNGASASDRRSRFEAEGSMDVAGFSVGYPLYEDAATRTVAAELGDGSSPVLLAEFNDRDTLRPSSRELADTLEAGGHPVTAHLVGATEAWQLFEFDFVAEELAPEMVELIETTARWIEERV